MRKKKATVAMMAALLVALAHGAPAMAGFEVPAGYVATEIGIPDVPGSPGFIGGLDRLSGGALVYFDGYDVLKFWQAAATSLFHPDPAVWGSFVKVDESDRIYFGESMLGEIYEIDPAGGAAAIGAVPGNYDLEFGALGAFISHNPVWDPENQVSLIDLEDASLDQILQTDGWSGPLAFDADGSLYYCRPTDLFGEVGAELYVFGPAQVAGAIGPDVLTLADGELMTDDLSGCYDMAYAPNAGGESLFVTSGSLFDNQVEKVDLATGEIIPFVTDSEGTGWSTYVRFQPGVNPFVADGGPYAGALTVNQGESIIEIRPVSTGPCFIDSVM